MPGCAGLVCGLCKVCHPRVARSQMSMLTAQAGGEAHILRRPGGVFLGVSQPRSLCGHPSWQPCIYLAAGRRGQRRPCRRTTRTNTWCAEEALWWSSQDRATQETWVEVPGALGTWHPGGV
jgi:hypothetical protein